MQDAIAACVRATLPEPTSYVPISFGQPQARGARGDTIVLNHVYRAKNKADSLVIYSQRFQVDSLTGYAKRLTP
ncbi:hypothetical protein GKZ68_21490 (plasmid) [Hymenobacter sp. BRD128]|uniref:hypothetical protein n=1 Tax=Hymenobacter sp. BRD128 TaxID=2675878 RepID=UPI0015649EC8|nr:hypothetical protein [Hymenobacter sp. BRD128]QKG59256.1 hypothetical protein GKZ68_21490 [Hymenobacter sp. BRD128]